MQVKADSEIVRSLKILAEKLGLDVSDNHTDRSKVNLKIRTSATPELSAARMEIASFKSDDMARAEIAAGHFFKLLEHLGAKDICVEKSNVSFTHFAYIPSLSIALAKVLDDLQYVESGDMHEYSLENTQCMVNLAALIKERPSRSEPATVWRARSERDYGTPTLTRA